MPKVYKFMGPGDLPAVEGLIREVLSPYVVSVEMEDGDGLDLWNLLIIKTNIPFEDLAHIFWDVWKPRWNDIIAKFGYVRCDFLAPCSHGCGRLGVVKNDKTDYWDEQGNLRLGRAQERICECYECRTEICERARLERGEHLRACFGCGKEFEQHTGWEAGGYVYYAKSDCESSRSREEVQRSDRSKPPYMDEEYCSEACAKKAIQEFFQDIQSNGLYDDIIEAVFGSGGISA